MEYAINLENVFEFIQNRTDDLLSSPNREAARTLVPIMKKLHELFKDVNTSKLITALMEYLTKKLAEKREAVIKQRRAGIKNFSWYRKLKRATSQDTTHSS